MPENNAPSPAIVWFRQDLRLGDNPALTAAIATGVPILCVYILEEHESLRPLGGASQWWLHQSLSSLSDDLKILGGDLVLYKGDPTNLIPKLAFSTGAKHVFWNRRYEPACVEIDKQIKAGLQDQKIQVRTFNANLLFEPWEIVTGGGTPYKVFSPFWRACLAASEPNTPIHKPKSIKNHAYPSESLEDWKLEPKRPNWANGFEPIWEPGETGAHKRFEDFLQNRLYLYKDKRDFPAVNATSGLSPHLHFGEISPRQIWRHNTINNGGNNAAKFMAEIGWREFSYSLLFHADDLAGKNWKREFDRFPWQDDEAHFVAWSKGQTGYPLVDAGMRELWATGAMHNRVRMVTASFLIKHLLIDWRRGENWFWDTLVDADAANNAASWQWVAGSGADAAPFFRIFNPYGQSQKFDPDGAYIRKWVPELAKLDNKSIHTPWEAPELVLKAANITLGETYPYPIVEHKAARERALAAYKTIKG